jgi:hypothetical protein
METEIEDNQLLKSREALGRISVIMLAIAFIFLIMLRSVSSQTHTAAPKPGKPLVKRLPAGIEGVELIGSRVRAKSGYKFVKRPDDTVTVARTAGGGRGAGIAGIWSCKCVHHHGRLAGLNPFGACPVEISGGTTLNCKTEKCTGVACDLTVKTGELTTAIIAY